MSAATSAEAAPEAAAGRGRFNISRWALEHRALTRYLLLVLLVLGAAAYFQLGQDEDPPFTFRAMAIRVFWPGATAQQVAEQVTDKLEKGLQEVPYADRIRSYSKPGEALILFQVRDSSPPKEMPQIWYTVRKKLGDLRGTLPPGVVGPYFNDEFGDVYGSIYALSADGYSYAELKEHADQVRQRLLKVKDVNKVAIFGAQDEKVFVEIAPGAAGAARPRPEPGAEPARPAERDRVGRHDHGAERFDPGARRRPVHLARRPEALPDPRRRLDLQARRHRRDPPGDDRPAAGQGAQRRQGGDRPRHLDGARRRHHPARQGAGEDLGRDSRRSAGGPGTAPVPEPGEGRVGLGQRVRRHADRGDPDRAGGELRRPRPALQAAAPRLAARAWWWRSRSRWCWRSPSSSCTTPASACTRSRSAR